MVMFSATAPMMTQPKIYLNRLSKTTFLRHCIDVDNFEYKIFKNGGRFLIRNLTEAQIRGLHVDGILIDEECKAKSDEVVNATYPILGTSRIGDGGIIRHITTSQQGTPAHTTWKRMQLDEPENCILRHYDDCPYISRATIAHAKKTFPTWFFLQEYECQWIAPAGRIFTNVIHGDFQTEISKENKMRDWVRTHDHAGVDWNPVFGHVVVWTRYDRVKSTCFVTHEQNLGNEPKEAIEILFTMLLQNPKMLMELEDGGTNIGFCEMYFMLLEDKKRTGEFSKEEYMAIAKRSYRRPWDTEGKNKMRSITALYPMTIMVDDARTPMTSEWLDKASWDKEKTDRPGVLKDPEMHWFDAFLHSAWVGRYG